MAKQLWQDAGQECELRMELKVRCDAFDMPTSVWITIEELEGENWKLRASCGPFVAEQMAVGLSGALTQLVTDFGPLRLAP